jgi:hypothetical protein
MLSAGHFEPAATGGGLWYGNETARGGSRWVRPAVDVTSGFCDNYVNDIISSYSDDIYKEEDDILFLAPKACGAQRRMSTTASVAANAVIAEYDKNVNPVPIVEAGNGGGYFGLMGTFDCKAQV